MNGVNQKRQVLFALGLALLILGLASGCGGGGALPPTPTPTPTPLPVNTLRITTGEWPPFASESLPQSGIYLHIIKEAFALAGLEVEYDFYLWARAWQLVETGEYEGSATWYKLPEREQVVRYPVSSFAENCDVFFHRADYVFDWQTVDDLVGQRIGLIIEYNTTLELEALQREGKSLTLDVTTNEVSNFKKLLIGRIDVFPSTLEVGLQILRKNFTSEEAAAITYHSKPWSCSGLYPVFNPQGPRVEELIQAYEHGLQQLKDSGRYDQMMQDFRNGAYDTE